jgi:hypothetical protein
MRALLLVTVAAQCAAIATEKMAAQAQKANCVLWFHGTKSLTAVQKWFQIEFGLNPSTRPSIYA